VSLGPAPPEGARPRSGPPAEVLAEPGTAPPRCSPRHPGGGGHAVADHPRLAPVFATGPVGFRRCASPGTGARRREMLAGHRDGPDGEATLRLALARGDVSTPRPWGDGRRGWVGSTQRPPGLKPVQLEIQPRCRSPAAHPAVLCAPSNRPPRPAPRCQRGRSTTTCSPSSSRPADHRRRGPTSSGTAWFPRSSGRPAPRSEPGPCVWSAAAGGAHPVDPAWWYHRARDRGPSGAEGACAPSPRQRVSGPASGRRSGPRWCRGGS